MEYSRSDRVGDLLIEIVSELLAKEVRDPRIGGVTVTAAKVSKDLKHARIYFTVLSEKQDRREVLAGLKSATGFIRTKTAKELKLRFAPAIEFLYDETADQVRRIDDLLRQAKK